MSEDYVSTSADIELNQFIKSLWLKKYNIIFYTFIFASILFSFLLILKEFINYETPTYYHQDIRFNKSLDQALYSELISEERIERAFESLSIDSKNLNASSLSLLNSSTRYEEMKKFIVTDTEELLINLLTTDNKNDLSNNASRENLWESYLNLDSNYYQLLLNNEGLTKTLSMQVIKYVIDDFNNEMIAKNTLKIDTIPLIDFKYINGDRNNNLDYISDRLDIASTIIRENQGSFENIGVDISDLSFKIKNLNSEIFDKDPRYLNQQIAKLEFEINQNIKLNSDLSRLYTEFEDNGSIIEEGKETQVTVDAISQLIELGRDMSREDFTQKIMLELFNIEIERNELEIELFNLKLPSLATISNEVNDLKSIYLKSENLIELVNSYSNIVNMNMREIPVYRVGNILENSEFKYDIKVFTITLASSLIFLFIYVISLYLRKIIIS